MKSFDESKVNRDRGRFATKDRHETPVSLEAYPTANDRSWVHVEDGVAVFTPVDPSEVRSNRYGLRGTPQFSSHVIDTLKSKNIPAENFLAAIRAPYKVTEVTRYPGQLRYCGYGVAVVMDGDRVITAYADGVPTSLREDQKGDSVARNSKRVNRR